MNGNEAVSGAVQPTRRRHHSKEFKEKVILTTMQPNGSIAAVALHYQLNANLLRRWVNNCFPLISNRFATHARNGRPASEMNRAGFVGDRRVWRYAACADSARFRL